MKQPLEIAKKALDMLVQAGADSAAAAASQSEMNELNAATGGFTLLRTTMDAGLVLTVIKDSRRGTAAVNDVSDEGIRGAVRECMGSAEAATPDENWGFCREAHRQTFMDGEPYDGDKMYRRAEELLSSLRQEYPAVSTEMMTLSHRAAHSAFVTSYGAELLSRRARYGATLSFLARDQEKSSGYSYLGLSSYGLDAPILDTPSFRAEIEGTVRSIRPALFEGKTDKGVVVFTPACLAEMLEFMAGVYLSDSALIDGTSPWKDKLGRQVADPRITLRSAPHHPLIVGGERFTGEGFLSEDCDIIREGRLQSFMLSLYAANKTGLPRARAGGLDAVMEGGDRPLSELIAGIERGVVVGGFSGGTPGPDGNFSGVAKRAFLIENGRVASALSETMVSGNIAAMLNNLVGLSRETVSTGSWSLPYAAVRGVTVSGK